MKNAKALSNAIMMSVLMSTSVVWGEQPLPLKLRSSF